MSSVYGAVQPPYLKPPDVSSLGPPGACITPSSVIIERTIIFRMILIFEVTSCWMQDARCKMPDAGCKMPDARYQMQDAERFTILDSRFSIHDSRFSILD